MSKKEKSSRSNAQVKVVKGTLDISRSGIGFVAVEGMDKDVLVRPNDFNRAFHGDTVKVQVAKHTMPGKRIEGKITEVVERKQTEFIGNLQVSKAFAFFTADTEKPMPDFFVPLDKLNGATEGDRAVVRLTNWSKDDKKPEGEVVTVIKAEDMNDFAMKELLIDAGFPIGFDDEVMKEALGLSENITRMDLVK